MLEKLVLRQLNLRLKKGIRNMGSYNLGRASRVEKDYIASLEDMEMKQLDEIAKNKYAL